MRSLPNPAAAIHSVCPETTVVTPVCFGQHQPRCMMRRGLSRLVPAGLTPAGMAKFAYGARAYESDHHGRAHHRPGAQTVLFLDAGVTWASCISFLSRPLTAVAYPARCAHQARSACRGTRCSADNAAAPAKRPGRVAPRYVFTLSARERALTAWPLPKHHP